MKNPEYYFFNVEGRLLPITPTKMILDKGMIESSMFDGDLPYPTSAIKRLRVLHNAFTSKRMEWGD